MGFEERLIIREKRKAYFRRRRRKRLFLLTFFFLFFLTLLTLYFYPFPASLKVQVFPSDALIKLASHPTSQGKLYLEKIEPGKYKLELTRKGFLPYSKEIELNRGQKLSLKIFLKPRSWSLKVLTHPPGATIKVKTEKGKVNSGQSPFVKSLPAGKVKLEISKKGFNTIKKSFFLEENTSLSFFLDPEGQILHCLNIFKCGGSPKGVAFAPGRKEVWVTLLGNRPAVRVFEPLSGKKLADIYLGKSGAVEITFLSDGSKAYISQMETAQVYEVETRKRQILRTFKTGSAWSKVVALSKDEKTLFVSNWSGNDVSEIDLNSGKLRRRLPTVKTPRGLFPTPDGKFLYVAGFGKGEIDLINLSNGKGKVIFNQGEAVRHLVAAPKRKILFASDLGQDCIWKVYLDSNKVEKFARTDHKPNTIDLTPDGKLLFVSCRGANNPKSYYLPGPEWGSVLVFDTQTGKPVDAVVGGNQCTALDVSPDGKLLIFSDFLDGTLRLYEIPPYEEFQKGKGGYYRAHLAKLSK